LLFDGQVRVYSTCRSCQQTMRVVDPFDTTHPCCEPQPTKLESLAHGWLSAVLAEDRRTEQLTAKEIERLENRAPNLHKAAMLYAEWGWPVFPLGRRSKLPAIPKSKGGRGFHDATTDVERVDRWWSRYPQHNIGIATGVAFDVIDIDPDKGGTMSWLELLARNRIDCRCSERTRTHLHLPDVHGIAVTAHGGMHMIVPPTGKGNWASKFEIAPGVDYRGRGGYIVAPPSLLGGRGRSYSWLVSPSPKLKGENRNGKAQRGNAERVDADPGFIRRWETRVEGRMEVSRGGQSDTSCVQGELVG